MSSALGKEMFTGGALDTKSFSLDSSNDIVFDDLPPGGQQGIARGWTPDATGTLAIQTPAGKTILVPCTIGGVYPYPATRFMEAGAGTVNVTRVVGGA